MTEPVLPVKTIMNGMCAEGVVTGWRGVAQGLEFLHDKVRVQSSKFALIKCSPFSGKAFS